jgi:cytochrome c
MFVNARLILSAGVILAGATLAPLAALAKPDLQVCDSHGLVRAAEIAMDHGCFGCHTLSTKRVGPPYREIAAKYERSPISVKALAAKIRDGGTGVWGTVVMPPNSISQEEAETLARWIQSL